MKNKYIIIGALLLGAVAQAQVNTQSAVNPNINQENPFLDASGYTGSFPNNQGKGLYFPKTDLTTWEFKTSGINPGKFKTYFDGMIVYNSGTGNTIAEPTKGGKQVAVTPGFYYFKNPNQTFPGGSIANGQWIRLGADAASSEGEWAYDAATNRINLKRSGTGSFKNQVYYDNATGQSYNINDLNNETYDREANVVISESVPTTTGFKNYIQGNSNSISVNLAKDGNANKVLNSNILTVDEVTTSAGRFVVRNGIDRTIISEKNKAPIYAVESRATRLDKNNDGNIEYISGSSSLVNINRGTVSGYANGLRAEVSVNTGDNVESIISMDGYSTAGKNMRSIGEMVGNRNRLTVANTSGKISNITGSTNFVEFYSGTNTDITNIYGYRYLGATNRHLNSGTISNHYGLYLNSVLGATNNYAIYTNAGKNSFNDLTEVVANTSDEYAMKIVNANGSAKGLNIKAGSTADAADTSLLRVESNSGSNILEVKAYREGRVGIGTANPTERLEVAGNVKAISFQGANGAGIFPDYVFQKYYTGISNIKTDYNFKTLSQVEDFVKTNGHLPGYKSAEAIKAQGYVDLMETQLTNVEKIEELYLHLMEKEKEVQDLKQRLERLEKLLK